MVKPKVLSFTQWAEEYYPGWEWDDSGLAKDDLEKEYDELKQRELKLYKNWMKR